MGHILISYNDKEKREELRSKVEQAGHWVMAVPIADVPNKILTHQPDLVVLHHRPPEEDGLQALPGLRTLSLKKGTPVILLSDTPTVALANQQMLSSEGGGLCLDVNTPPRELLGAIQNLVKQDHADKQADRFFRHGHLELDRETRTMRLGNAFAADIPQRSFDLLWLLAKKSLVSKQILPRSFILSKLFKKRVRDRQVDVIISRLKSQIPLLAPCIETIPGKGYRLVLPPLVSPAPLSNREIRVE